MGWPFVGRGSPFMAEEPLTRYLLRHNRGLARPQHVGGLPSGERKNIR